MHYFNIINTPLLSPDRTMEIVLDAINDVIDYELAVVLSLEADDILKVKKAKGPLYTPRLKDFTISLKERNDISEIIKQGEVYLFHDDIEKNLIHLDTYDEILNLPAGHSCLLAPLHIEGNLLGLLTLDHRKCDKFTPEIVSLTKILSRIIALALAQSSAADLLIKERDALVVERNTLLEDVHGSLKDLVGKSDVWLDVLDKIKMVASTDTAVLIDGETGTGKEKAARAIHSLSPRAHRPFVALNCSALVSSLAESELFGHERGSFTGAVTRRKGRFELANTGTLFLDEIGDLPLEIQPKLLRAIQEGAFERVGGEKQISSDVRIICATNIDLEKAIKEGKFREDLYYRLNVFQINLPPLREREDDVVLLTEYFLTVLAKKFSKPSLQVSEEALDFIRQNYWAGNVRELQNTLERASILANNKIIEKENLISQKLIKKRKQRIENQKNNEDIQLNTLNDAIKLHIQNALQKTNGKIYGPDGAANLLGIKPTTLQSKMKRMKIMR